MATITSATSGNWSAGATWVGGVVPTAVDDVIIGAGHTVTADVDITVLTISGAANIASNLEVTTNRTITCTGANGITAKAVNNGLGLVRITGVGITVNINSNHNMPFPNSVSFTVDVLSNCIVNLVGNIILTGVNGNISTIRFGGGGTVNLIGNISGGSPHAGVGTVVFSSTCLLNITGNIIAQQGTAILVTFNSNINIIGTVSASTNSSAILNNQTTIADILVLGSLFSSSNGRIPIKAPIIKLSNSGTSQWEFATDVVNTNKTLYSAGVDLGNPAIEDVRDGVTYASGALTGTLKVPPSTAVSVAVPVDNTVGSAVVTVSDLGALLASYNV